MCWTQFVEAYTWASVSRFLRSMLTPLVSRVSRVSRGMTTHVVQIQGIQANSGLRNKASLIRWYSFGRRHQLATHSSYSHSEMSIDIVDLHTTVDGSSAQKNTSVSKKRKRFKCTHDSWRKNYTRIICTHARTKNTEISTRNLTIQKSPKMLAVFFCVSLSEPRRSIFASISTKVVFSKFFRVKIISISCVYSFRIFWWMCFLLLPVIICLHYFTNDNFICCR